MNLALIALFVTLLVGPLMFYVLQNFESLDKKLPRFPSGLTAWLGDIFFLPLFNAFSVYYGVLSEIQQQPTVYILLLSVVVYFGYLKYKKDLSNFNHWLRPEKGRLSITGWYHSLYFFTQFFFIAASLYYLSNNVFLWFFLGGYLITLFHSKKKYGL